ncbi:ABC transporter ATP-binding protein [Actinospica durhamensis]|uniref:ABC transporter ATP-binding protein n=1 Tax=Actinospica durhamensis TaxID=1508375 RepID=A0A941EQC0_9ACTN|nr:ABC transporter ATP-binding protein [Actinospica durhamensis]MBR7834592.1 ABC transporter ATP-binding protein [Actinospica durhamensis]
MSTNSGSPAGLSDTVLTVDNLTVDFPTPDGAVHAVRGVSYRLNPGEVLGIVGESGSGKSVTSMAVMGLLPKTAKVSGSVRFRDRELLGLSDNEMKTLRGNKIAMIFQDPMTSLNPVYKVGHQLAEAVLAHHDIPKAKARARAIELLEMVDIPQPDRRVDQYPHEFSGGMRQRVVIAIAMANNPDVIIADEPTTALDVTVQAQVLDSLRAAQRETGAAMVLITHDLGVVAGQADRVLVMYAGKPVEIGGVDDIYYNPRMPYTLGLLGSLPRLDQREAGRLTPIQGSPPSLVNLPLGCPFTPRCPLAQDVCETREPDLEPVDADEAGPDGHRSACHFKDRVARHRPADLFDETSADAELPGDFGSDSTGEEQAEPHGPTDVRSVNTDFGTESDRDEQL